MLDFMVKLFKHKKKDNTKSKKNQKVVGKVTKKMVIKKPLKKVVLGKKKPVKKNIVVKKPVDKKTVKKNTFRSIKKEKNVKKDVKQRKDIVKKIKKTSYGSQKSARPIVKKTPQKIEKKRDNSQKIKKLEVKKQSFNLEKKVVKTVQIATQPIKKIKKTLQTFEKNEDGDIPKAYVPTNVEQIIYNTWIKQDSFSPRDNKKGEKFVIPMPPPNVTGMLHLGHALTLTLEDIMVRYHRMLGHETLYIPGTDHAGISTQVVVEKRLAEEGKKREEMGREAFLEEVWKWKDTYHATIVFRQQIGRAHV